MRDRDDDTLTRRGALAVLGGATLAALPGCTAERPRPRHEARPMNTAQARMPVVYLPHGGGPWPFVDMPLGDPAQLRSLADYLRSLKDLPARRPEAVLMISAHWEEPSPTVMTAARPPMLFDYYGFPPEAYTLTWPAPGSPALAARVRSLLGGAGITTAESSERGFDHGAFVPMKLTWPEAEVPTIQLSLQEGLDPARHIAIGRALAPLRDEGVFILGSGMSFHNMRAFRGGGAVNEPSQEFDRWLAETVALPAAERDARLERWSTAPSARYSHPREEHLLPLMVVAGAAGEDRGRVGWTGDVLTARVSGFHFG